MIANIARASGCGGHGAPARTPAFHRDHQRQAYQEGTDRARRCVEWQYIERSHQLHRTNYYETVTASGDNLRWALGMEEDRMVNAKRMTMVRNEFERGADAVGPPVLAASQ